VGKLITANHPQIPELQMNIQLLTRTSILSLVVVMLCAAPLAFAQTKDTTAVDVPRQVAGMTYDDMDITKRVKSAIVMDNAFSGFNIVVVTTKGDVRLTGNVDSKEQIQQILAIARSVDGVKTVHDELKVKP
jgi:osmotically-inducible protein OsmY